MAGRIRPEGVDRRRRGKDRRAIEESLGLTSHCTSMRGPVSLDALRSISCREQKEKRREINPAPGQRRQHTQYWPVPASGEHYCRLLERGTGSGLPGPQWASALNGVYRRRLRPRAERPVGWQKDGTAGISPKCCYRGRRLLPTAQASYFWSGGVAPLPGAVPRPGPFACNRWVSV